MKKAYESPKVEKMAFNYSDAVVASSDNCRWTGPFTFKDTGCNLYPDPDSGMGHYVGNMT